MPTYYQSEIVDDSEPEREELRRRQKFAHKVNLRNTKAIRSAPLAVIEITDDESDAAAHEMPLLHETADEGLEFRATTARELLGLASDVSGNSNTPASGAAPTQHTRILASETDITHITRPIPNVLIADAQSDHEAEDARANFARFAYLDTTSLANVSRNRPGLSRRCSDLSSTIDSRLLPKKRLPHRFVGVFSDVELGKLGKCVSCEVLWTARKTAAQKMLHIQSCARKNSFSDETIRILIRKEIDSCASTTAPSNGKGKAVQSVPTDPKTFLEEVVAEAAPRKKGRRLETRETVKSVTQTRKLILNRARAIIGSTSASVGAQAVENHDLGSVNAILPSTQTFGTSALAQRHNKATSNLFSSKSQETSDAEESDAEIPSTLMTFAPSKLDGMRQPIQRLPEGSPALSYNDVTTRQKVFPANSIPASFRTTSPFDISDLSSRERSRVAVAPRTNNRTGRLDMSPQATPSLTFEKDENGARMFHRSKQFNEFGRDNDDACLHFNPGDDGVLLAEESTTSPTSSTPTVSKTINVKSLRPRSLKKSPTKTKGVREVVSTPPRKKAGTAETPETSRKKKVQVEHECDDVWERKMKEKIMRNGDLHLRILRYEPIHFDVFLKMAVEESSASGKLKLRLRSFLDKQAIHFYGAEPSTGRRGRRH